MNVNLLILILILSWTINPFIKKISVKKLGNNENLILNHIFVTLVIILYTSYIITYNKLDIKLLKSMEYKDILINFIGALVTFSSSICLYKILQQKDISEVIPIIQPSVIILSLGLGYFIFNETLTKYKIIGTLLVSYGIYLIKK